ncbi:Rgr1p PWA37_000046 [Arxiozyma heterogenica]|uniref:Rgr1p n=1 Tax=Arxiozyma heterogenica TaxID=278026 RepID=UPI002EF9515C
MTTNITEPHLINEVSSSAINHTNNITKEYTHQTTELNNKAQNNGTSDYKNSLDTNTVTNVVEPTVSEIKFDDNVRSSANLNKNNTANMATPTNSIPTSSSSLIPPPPIPHVEINQVPLSLIIRNITVYTIKEISQFLKTNLHQSFENNPSIKKVNFVKLIIFLRNQFLKLYVLIKWTKTIKNNNFHVLIDLLNWFRITNMTVNNCIWTFKNSLISMTNAKLPDVDLVTALEVLSLGRPNLPTYNLKLSGDINSNSEAIPTDLILKRLKDLNLVVSIKIALMDIPPQFNNYYIKNGRIYITVENEFEIQLSTIDRHSPLFFVDLNLIFNHSKDSNDFNNDVDSNSGTLNNSEVSNYNNQVTSRDRSHNIISNTNVMNDCTNCVSNKRMGNAIEYDLSLNKRRLEKIINELLLKSSKPLYSLYQFLHKYVLTLQLYMIHAELTNLETFGKFSGGGNLAHSYDSKKGKIIGRYWLNGKLGNKGKFTIGVDRQSESLVLRWDNKIAVKEGKDNKRIPIIYTNILQNMENILDEIMFNHANLIRSDLLSRGIFQEDEDDPTILLLHIPVTCVSVAPAQLKIDPITGQLYFKNPSPLLIAYTKKINRTETSNELIIVLQQLKLDKITTILKNMFQKTGWICSRAVTLEKPIDTKLISNKYVDEKENPSQNNDELVLLQRDLFICLPNWPSNWYLILTIISSNSSCIVEKRMGKIVSQKGKWKLTYVDQTSATSSKLENITYQKIMSLQKTILHRIVNHMLIDSLNHLKIKNRICSPTIIQDILPSYLTSIQAPDPKNKLTETDDVNVNRLSTSFNEDYTPILRLELDSFLDCYNTLGGILENSMFMRIDYVKSDIRLYARFKRGIMLEQVKCEEMLIYFVREDPLTFYMTEKFSSLSHIVTYLNLFKEKLMQLVIITDVVERLHKNFESDHFKIMALKPNEISFKYLKSNIDMPDCSINIITEESKIKNLSVKLSETNPQSIIQPYLNQENMPYHSIFNYLQFTSLFFTTLQKILKEHAPQKENQLTTVHLGIHSLTEYQLIYCNIESGTKITVMINIKSVCHNSKRKVQYYVHFADDEHITTKSLAYPQVHQVKNQIFMFDSKKQAFSSSSDPVTERKYPRAIRLIDGISCDAQDIEPILLDVHDILKVDSNC